MDLLKKIIKGFIVTGCIVLLPAIWKSSFLSSPHPWILLSIGILAAIYQPDYNPFDKASKVNDKGTALGVIWSIYLMQFLAVIEAIFINFPNSVKWDTISTFSLILMLLGLALRAWSYTTLGNLFSMHIAVQSNHRIIKDGPYKYMRHPSYTGAFIVSLFANSFLHSWITFFLSIIVLLATYYRRIHYEEIFLIKIFGKEYEDYCSKVKMVIPYIW